MKGRIDVPQAQDRSAQGRASRSDVAPTPEDKQRRAEAALQAGLDLWAEGTECVGGVEFATNAHPKVRERLMLSALTCMLAQRAEGAMRSRAAAEHPNDQAAQEDRFNDLMEDECDRVGPEARRALPFVKRLRAQARPRVIGRDKDYGGVRLDATPVYRQALRLACPQQYGRAGRTLRLAARATGARPVRRRGSRRVASRSAGGGGGDSPGSDSEPEGPGRAFGRREQHVSRSGVIA